MGEKGEVNLVGMMVSLNWSSPNHLEVGKRKRIHELVIEIMS
jgi:hypothetical protein